MWKYFSANSTTRYFDILPALLHQYNHSVHRSTGMTPHDASQKENEEEVRIKLQGKSRARAPKAKFRIGEQVRIAKLKRHFEKGYSPKLDRRSVCCRSGSAHSAGDLQDSGLG